MAVDPAPRQLRLEAERAQMSSERLGISSAPKAGDRVLPQAEGAYRPPPFLSKVAPPEDVDALAEILGELRSVNQEHVGEEILQVAAYYALTGRRRDIIERLVAWCRRF